MCLNDSRTRESFQTGLAQELHQRLIYALLGVAIEQFRCAAGNH
jgi:hypothetical protein